MKDSWSISSNYLMGYGQKRLSHDNIILRLRDSLLLVLC